ncbi:hypothetical protein YPPY45_2598, partial [Yersinia pestis PY-45]
MNYNAVMNYR